MAAIEGGWWILNSAGESFQRKDETPFTRLPQKKGTGDEEGRGKKLQVDKMAINTLNLHT